MLSRYVPDIPLDSTRTGGVQAGQCPGVVQALSAPHSGTYWDTVRPVSGLYVHT